MQRIYWIYIFIYRYTCTEYTSTFMHAYVFIYIIYSTYMNIILLSTHTYECASIWSLPEFSQGWYTHTSMCMCYLYAELFLTKSDHKQIDRESAIVMIDYMLMWPCPVDLQISIDLFTDFSESVVQNGGLDSRKYHQTWAWQGFDIIRFPKNFRGHLTCSQGSSSSRPCNQPGPDQIGGLWVVW